MTAPITTSLLKKNEQYSKRNICLQQYGAPPHYPRVVRQHINNVFRMAPRSITCWIILKNNVCNTYPTNMQKIEDRITREITENEQSGML